MTCFRQRHREKGNILGTATGQGVGVKELGQEIEFLWHGKERGMPLTLQKNALNFSIELLKSSGQNCKRFKCGTLDKMHFECRVPGYPTHKNIVNLEHL